MHEIGNSFSHFEISENTRALRFSGETRSDRHIARTLRVKLGAFNSARGNLCKICVHEESYENTQ